MRAEPRGRPNPPSSDLPAPYSSPWKRLGADLEAVGADLVLAVMLMFAGLALGLGFRREASPPAPAGEVEEAGPIAELAPSFEAEEPFLSPPSIGPPTITGEAQSEPEPGPGDHADPDPDLEPEPVPSPEPGPAEVLRAAFADIDAEGVIVAVRPDAASAVLQLEVGDGFARLEPRRRRRLAEDWAVLVAERDYERLEVVDGRGRLWVRPAAVGGGLVVLGYPVAPEPR